MLLYIYWQKQYANYHLISHVHVEIIFHIHFNNNNNGNELLTHSDDSMNGYYDLLFSKVFDAFNSQNDNLIFIAMGDDNNMKINKGFKSTKNS